MTDKQELIKLIAKKKDYIEIIESKIKYTKNELDGWENLLFYNQKELNELNQRLDKQLNN